MAKVFLINGYWADDETPLDNVVIVDTDSPPAGMIDEEIFYYGLEEDDIKSHILTGEPVDNEFVITSYEEDY